MGRKRFYNLCHWPQGWEGVKPEQVRRPADAFNLQPAGVRVKIKTAISPASGIPVYYEASDSPAKGVNPF